MTGRVVDVAVPGSSANLGPGYDCLGVALPLSLRVRVTERPGPLEVAVRGEGADTLPHDATNLVVAPGFIDLLGQSEFNVLVDGRAASKILQGITTEVTGEGTSIAPVNDRVIQERSDNATQFGVAQDWRTLADYFKRIEERSKTAINVATFVGAGGIRNYVTWKW